jgi:lysophospholipase L1-like esterase
MKRKWVDDVEFPEVWNVPFSIAKHNVYMYWSHPTLYPCDQMGFRVPSRFKSFKEKYFQSEGVKRIFCLGGSTTFGLFDAYENSYPHKLECSLRSVEVFNFGLCGLDSTGSMHVLLDLLRLGYVPDVVVFLDGINEKQGWLQASEGHQKYEEISWQYRCFREAIYEGNVPMTLRWQKKEGIIGRLRRKLVKLRGANTPKPNHDPMRFVESQSDSYTKTNKAIRNVASAWGFEVKFFLEPTVWDVWGGAHDLHYDYIKSLYGSVVAGNSHVVDLSNQVLLSAEDFIEWKHLNAHGHEMLAKAIAHYLE